MRFGVGLMHRVEPLKEGGEILGDVCRAAAQVSELKMGCVVFDGEGAGVKLTVAFEHRIAVRALRVDLGPTLFASEGINAPARINYIGVADGDRPFIRPFIVF